MFSVLSLATETRSAGSIRVRGMGWLKHRGEGGGVCNVAQTASTYEYW